MTKMTRWLKNSCKASSSKGMLQKCVCTLRVELAETDWNVPMPTLSKKMARRSPMTRETTMSARYVWKWFWRQANNSAFSMAALIVSASNAFVPGEQPMTSAPPNTTLGHARSAVRQATSWYHLTSTTTMDMTSSSSLRSTNRLLRKSRASTSTKVKVSVHSATLACTHINWKMARNTSMNGLITSNMMSMASS